ncbi:1-acyl-sn-glycerol-3-phosphate acyltransferase beta [Schistosoma japonicum]
MCLHILYYVGVIFACIPILYRIPKVQYYTKFTVFCLSILVGSFYYSIRLAFEGRRYENAWMFIKHLTFSGKLIGLNPVVENAQLLPKEPCIYVLNHQSLIDVASVGGIWPKRCAVVSKASLKFIGPLGLIIWLSRTITIDRSHHSDAISTMDKAAEAAKRDQVSVCIFPEGTRSDADNLLPFKKGAFHMAIKCQFPIQPVVIEPYSKFLNHKEKRFESATYRVRVLPKIDTKGMDKSQVDELLNETRKKMVAAIELLRNPSN